VTGDDDLRWKVNDDLRRKVNDRVERGEDLCAAILAEGKALRQSFQGEVWYWREYGWVGGIAAFLRSERPLSPDDREWLARFVEGKVRLPRGRPPGFNKQDTPLQRALAIAAFYVKESISKWTAAGEKRRGLTAKAIEAAAAEWCPSGMEPVDFQEKLATFLARSTRRR